MVCDRHFIMAWKQHHPSIGSSSGTLVLLSQDSRLLNANLELYTHPCPRASKMQALSSDELHATEVTSSVTYPSIYLSMYTHTQPNNSLAHKALSISMLSVACVSLALFMLQLLQVRHESCFEMYPSMNLNVDILFSFF